MFFFLSLFFAFLLVAFSVVCLYFLIPFTLMGLGGALLTLGTCYEPVFALPLPTANTAHGPPAPNPHGEANRPCVPRSQRPI